MANKNNERADIKATIFDIKRFAIHDGPGIRTTVFFKGCGMECVWCHNPEGIAKEKDMWIGLQSCLHCDTCIKECLVCAITKNSKGDPEINKKLCDFCDRCIYACPANCITRIDRTISLSKLLDEVLKDRLFYEVTRGGVTLSGGEPMLQKDFVIEFLKSVKKNNINTCIETSMHCELDALKKAAVFTDLFITDIKLIKETDHIRYTGVSNKLILENFTFLAQNESNIVVRIPLIPGITATHENIEGITVFVKGISPDIRIELLNYNELGCAKYERLGLDYSLSNLKTLTAKEVEELNRIVCS